MSTKKSRKIIPGRDRARNQAESFAREAFRRRMVSSFPRRYAISKAPPGVETAISLSYARYPVDAENEGYFRCSDEMLNRICEVGKFTLEMCRQSLHLDSPLHQETLGCTGDYAIEALMTRAAFGDMRLTRLDLLRTADYEPCDHEVFDIRLFEAQTMYILVFTPRHETKPLKEKYRAVKVMVE